MSMSKQMIAIILTIAIVSTSLVAVVAASCGPATQSTKIQTEDLTYVEQSYYSTTPSPLPAKEWASWYDAYASKAGVFYDEGSGSWCSNSLNVELAAMHAAFDMQDAASHANAEQQAMQTANVIAKYHARGIYA